MDVIADVLAKAIEAHSRPCEWQRPPPCPQVGCGPTEKCDACIRKEDADRELSEVMRSGAYGVEISRAVGRGYVAAFDKAIDVVTTAIRANPEPAMLNVIVPLLRDARGVGNAGDSKP